MSLLANLILRGTALTSRQLISITPIIGIAAPSLVQSLLRPLSSPLSIAIRSFATQPTTPRADTMKDFYGSNYSEGGPQPGRGAGRGAGRGGGGGRGRDGRGGEGPSSFSLSSSQDRNAIGPRDQIGIFHILSTNNNTFATLTDRKGQVKICNSAGMLGFRNSRKSTPVAGNAVVLNVARKAKSMGFGRVEVRMRGFGRGKYSAVRALAKSRLHVLRIVEMTNVPHNGCRPPRRRRI